MKPLGVARRLLRVVPDYAKIAWWGRVRPNVGRERPLVGCQGVILRGDLDAPEDLDVLLSVRSDLRGWELPGGNPDPGEPPHDTLCREVRAGSTVPILILTARRDEVDRILGTAGEYDVPDGAVEVVAEEGEDDRVGVGWIRVIASDRDGRHRVVDVVDLVGGRCREPMRGGHER